MILRRLFATLLLAALACGEAAAFNRIVRDVALPIRHNEAAAYIAAAQAAVGAPMPARDQRAVNDFFSRAKADGTLPILSFVYVGYAYAEGAALLDWLHPTNSSYTLVKTNSPVFTAYTGYSDDASNRGYENAINFDALPGFAQDAAHLSGYWMSGTAHVSQSLGGGGSIANNVYIIPKRTTANTMRARTNDVELDDSTVGTVTAVAGDRVTVRNGASARQFYVDGAAAGTSSAASTSVKPNPLRILHNVGDSGVSASQTIGIVTAGGALTVDHAAALYSNKIKTLRALGAGI